MASIKVLAIRPKNGRAPVFVSGSVRDDLGDLKDVKVSDSVAGAIEFYRAMANELTSMRNYHLITVGVDDYEFIVIDTLKYYQHGSSIHATPPEEVF